MTLTPEDRRTLTQARAIKARERKAAKAARAEKVVPVAKGQRQPRVRERGYLAFVRRLPCVAGLVEGACHCHGPIHAAHVRFSIGRVVNPGMGSKPDDRYALPLCSRHHLHDQHRGSERAFYERLGVSPHALCDALHAAYEFNGSAAALLDRVAKEARMNR